MSAPLERGEEEALTLTLYLWWETLYRGDVVEIVSVHCGWSKITKTSSLDGGREQSMQEVRTLTIESDEVVHVSIESASGGTLAHAFFSVDAKTGTVDMHTSTDVPRQLMFEVLHRGDAQTYTGKIRYRLCQRRGSPRYGDDLYERKDEALAACEQKGLSPDYLVVEHQTRWLTWE